MSNDLARLCVELLDTYGGDPRIDHFSDLLTRGDVPHQIRPGAIVFRLIVPADTPPDLAVGWVRRRVERIREIGPLEFSLTAIPCGLLSEPDPDNSEWLRNIPGSGGLLERFQGRDVPTACLTTHSQGRHRAGHHASPSHGHGIPTDRDHRRPGPSM